MVLGFSRVAECRQIDLFGRIESPHIDLGLKAGREEPILFSFLLSLFIISVSIVFLKLTYFACENFLLHLVYKIDVFWLVINLRNQIVSIYLMDDLTKR